MITVYLVCAIAGTGFVALTSLLGHSSHGGGHAGALGHGGHSGSVAHAGHTAVGDGQGADGQGGGLEAAITGYLSPTAFAAYTTGFGAAGLILTRGLGLQNPLIHVPLAAASAAGFGLGLLWTLGRIADRTERNSLGSLDELVGQPAEVTIAIPSGGSGEVAFVAGGTRQTNSARADGGQQFSQGATVLIRRAADGVVWVGGGEREALGAAVAGEPVAALPSKQKVR